MFKNELNIVCPICHRDFDSPIVLPCGETICTNCIKTLRSESNKLLCELCNSIHEIPEHGFQLNKALIKVIENKSDNKIQRRIKSVLDIENKLEYLKKSFEKSRENIKHSVSLIINEIQETADYKIKEINQIRDNLIENVLNYERDCLQNFNDYNVEYFEFINEIKPYETNKDFFINNSNAAELIRSKLEIQIQKFKNTITNFENFEFRKNTVPMNVRALGVIYEHHLDSIRISEFIKLDFSKHFSSSSELRRNVKMKKLNEQFYLIGYALTSYGIDIDTLSNNIFYKLVLEIHDLNQLIRRFEIEMEQNETDYIIEASDNIIILYINHSIWTFNFNLTELSKVKFPHPINNLLISNKSILCLSHSNFGVSLHVLDFGLNILKIYSNLNQNILYLPKDTQEVYANENYYFFRERNQLFVVDRDDGKYVKKFEFNENYQIINVNDANVIVVFEKVNNKINFLDFDGNIRDYRGIEPFPNENTQIVMNDNYSIQLIDSQNLVVYV